MTSSGQPGNRKVAAEAEASDSTDNTDNQDMELINVVDDFFAIDKVIDWRGEGRAREYKIRWKGGGQPSASAAQHQWLKPSDLCKGTLREAHALVRADKARQKALDAMDEDGTLPPPSTLKKKKRKAPPPDASSKSSSSKKASSKIAGQKVALLIRQTMNKILDSVVNETVKSALSNKASSKIAGRKVTVHETTNESMDFNVHNGELLQSVSKKTKAMPKKARISKKDKKRAAKDDHDDDAGMDPEERIRRELARGNDIELVDFQPVIRIDVNEENAREKVSQARTNGIPVVLTGHLGWPQFAARWLKDVVPSDPLDLARNHELDIESIIRDIGNEEVPIVEKHYDERNPTGSSMKASIFLQKHWPKSGETPDKRKKLYMQQWQFPYSDEASSIMCGPSMCSPPPPVFYEDLLPFWLDQGGNPYQYLFMGDTDTMSKLHKDPGGLDILISPIVGEKECILAHRLDGDHMYDLRSKLDKVDLLQFPMTAFTRLWKTTVKPGEILVMPHDTYHQCRNVTPCLSYHRLHLDAINLRGFLESMYTGDAENMEHTEVLWNTGSELMQRVEDYLERYKMSIAKDESQKITVDPHSHTDEGIAETVKVLRLLQSAFLAIARFLEGPSATSRRWLTTYTTNDWKQLIGDIGETLYDYRNRDKRDVSRYRRPNFDTLLTNAEVLVDDSEDSSDEEGKAEYNGKWHLSSALQAVALSMGKLAYLRPNEEDLVISDSVKLKAGDEILVRLDKRCAQGIVKKIENMTALLVTYDDLPSTFDEFQPRSQVQGNTDASRHAMPSALRPSHDASLGIQQLVRCIPCCDPEKQLRQAKALSSRTGTFYKIELRLNCGSTTQRWMCRDSFIRKVD